MHRTWISMKRECIVWLQRIYLKSLIQLISLFLYMILKSLSSSRNQMTVLEWWKTVSLCYNFCIALVQNVDWKFYLISRDACKHGPGMQFYIWRCSHEHCLQEDAFSTFMVERRLCMFCVCISFLNDPALFLRSLLAVTHSLCTSCSQAGEVGKISKKSEHFCSSKTF